MPFVRGDRITAGTKASVFCFDKKTKNIDLSGVDLFALASLHYGIKQKTELKITDTKQRVINALKTVFGDDLIFFIEPDKTFKNGFAFGLKEVLDVFAFLADHHARTCRENGDTSVLGGALDQECARPLRS